VSLPPVVAGGAFVVGGLVPAGACAGEALDWPHPAAVTARAAASSVTRPAERMPAVIGGGSC
jgi:hypothetical protein